ncbi:MAG: hypothetical protein M3220_02735 [Chloroflexota bacterium]|nr:hypothetical protein [Chloroflexota bacterium]
MSHHTRLVIPLLTGLLPGAALLRWWLTEQQAIRNDLVAAIRQEEQQRLFGLTEDPVRERQRPLIVGLPLTHSRHSE